jgi:uncharacterized protein
MEKRSLTNSTKREQSPSAADALTFNVAGFLAEPLGSICDLSISAPPLDLGTELVAARGVTGTVRLTRTNRGLLLHGRLNTAIKQVCSRCLRDLNWAVDMDLDEEALPSIDFTSGAPLDPAVEPEILRLNDHHELELEGEVRDAMLLAEPIAPLCRPDCPGLCVVCGEELSSGPHDHPDAEIDPRLEVLRGLLDEQGS